MDVPYKQLDASDKGKKTGFHWGPASTVTLADTRDHMCAMAMELGFTCTGGEGQRDGFI